jgi:hypothetical protein
MIRVRIKPGRTIFVYRRQASWNTAKLGLASAWGRTTIADQVVKYKGSGVKYYDISQRIENSAGDIYYAGVMPIGYRHPKEGEIVSWLVRHDDCLDVIG